MVTAVYFILPCALQKWAFSIFFICIVVLGSEDHSNMFFKKNNQPNKKTPQ